MRVAIFFLSFLISLSLSGQDFQADLDKMQAAYRSHDSFGASFSVEVYRGAGQRPIQKMEGSILRSGERLHYKMPESEMLISEGKILQISHGAKQMNLAEVGEKQLKAAFAYTAPEIEPILQDQKKAELIASEGKVHTWRIHRKGEIAEVYLSIDIHSGLLLKVEYLYNEDLYPGDYRAVISYQNASFSPRIGKDELELEAFLKEDKGKYAAQAAYQSYQLNVSN